MYNLLQAANGLLELHRRLNEYNELELKGIAALNEWRPKIDAALSRTNTAFVSLGMPEIKVEIPDKMIVWKFFEDFRATTEENYNARISNARKIWNFTKHDGFNSFDDVVNHIEKCFGIDRENIIIKE